MTTAIKSSTDGSGVAPTAPDAGAGMRPGPFYSGLALLTFATLMLEVVETRLLSVVAWYHLAFFVISAAMFGMTAGAIWVYRRREHFRRETLPDDLVVLTCGFAIATAVSVALQATLATVQALSATFVLVFLELSLVVAAPFFFSGAAVSLALTRSPFPIGRVYAADLAGAALGCLGVLVALGPLDAVSTILLAGAGGAGAALLFTRSGGAVARRVRHPLARPVVIFVILAAAGLLNALTDRGVQPLVVKDSLELRRGDVRLEKWNSFSRVQAYTPFKGAPILWGASARTPRFSHDQIPMNIDGDAATVMYKFDGNADHAAFLRYDVTNLGYYIRSSGQAVVLGAGSGRDVLAARVFGFDDVTGVEINPTFVNLLTRREPYTGFAGLARLPGIRLVMAEARSWMSRTRQTFDFVQMSMIDTWAATGAGAFTLTENGLYTQEAWKIFLSRLKPDGIFSVSRWYAPTEVGETGRIVSLAAASLLNMGVDDVRSHLLLASSGCVATLLVARDPFRSDDIATLRRVCRELEYRVILSPDSGSISPLLDRIVSARSLHALERETSGLELDLKPPTDDRPFFFNVLPLNKPQVAWRYLRKPEGVIRETSRRP